MPPTAAVASCVGLNSRKLGASVDHVIKAHGGWASDCVWDYIAPGRFQPSKHIPNLLDEIL